MNEPASEPLSEPAGAMLRQVLTPADAPSWPLTELSSSDEAATVTALAPMLTTVDSRLVSA